MDRGSYCGVTAGRPLVGPPGDVTAVGRHPQGARAGLGPTAAPPAGKKKRKVIRLTCRGVQVEPQTRHQVAQVDIVLPDTCTVVRHLDLHHEIEDLRSRLRSSTIRAEQMEVEFSESRDLADLEISKLQDELSKLRDRYDRLYESHKKLTKVNQTLEEKLLNVVSDFDKERNKLQHEVTSLTSRLADAKVTISDLDEENERYRSDCNTAVQLLQCKPSNFVAHKLNTLPVDLQERVKSHLSRAQLLELEQTEPPPPPPESKMIRVPMATFPPTAMVYSVNKISPPAPEPPCEDGRTDSVPTQLIARVLAQPVPEQKPRRIYVCSRCRCDVTFHHRDVQTDPAPSNGYHGNRPGVARPAVHRPRQGSTETEI